MIRKKVFQSSKVDGRIIETDPKSTVHHQNQSPLLTLLLTNHPFNQAKICKATFV